MAGGTSAKVEPFDARLNQRPEVCLDTAGDLPELGRTGCSVCSIHAVSRRES
jgi:hypothetical protein